MLHLVAMAWIYVVVLMAAAELMSSDGSWLGALFTLLFYGALPLSIVLYLLATPMRRRARRKREAASAAQPDGSGHAPGDPVAPVRKEG